ncbi:MAG: Aspartyl/glutamyl-tRNA(Asn/Gln) amidotransferase subunit B [candidate division TM6 bacterium GW2011_GWE2_42_60]|nr:MAG: Aspartyl/glutamyl-tRNA(Asn/Gln) amidotransferase subunit B [candidate division TM6 bacterium GW2011_GWE2_42_60]HBY05795.1 Asp-tRNA(Asn)/Glu-tRNA(Gln) amidotransferase GatCAB subunit B [Candidatus Dependentiae bacterium]
MSRPITTLERYQEYQVDIGIEVHVQLSTKSKIFCAAENGPSKNPNQNIDPICAGYPGVLPVLNKKVVHYAIMTGLATNCTINRKSEFSRKHYFYPDLPKGFQITQGDKPICLEGYVPIRLENGDMKNIRLIRIHMEEDAGKNIHAPNDDISLVDLNRAGSPLLEIVSYPDMKSAYEARTYLKTLHAIVTYLNVCSGNMEDGAFRADTNISVRKKSATQLGTRCELKNINSFKFISDAIEYEVERQILLLESGQKVTQETRLWDTKDQKTFSMRSKEEAADYRYFPEPDLPPVCIDERWIEQARAEMPELPFEKSERLQKKYALKTDDVDILIGDRELADYYEKAAKTQSSSTLINWVLRDLLGFVKEHKIALSDCKVTPEKLAQLVHLVDQGKINNRAGQEIFAVVAETGKDPQALVKELGLEQMGDSSELDAVVQKLIAENPTQVADYKAGKTKLMSFFVGQAMAQTKGRGNPQIFQELFKKYLEN